MSDISALAKTHITEQEYLEGEKIGDIRHEYVDGKVCVISGNTKQHNRITMNLAIALKQVSRTTTCNVFHIDLKLRIASRKSYYYPDVLVTCDKDDNQDEYYIDKPCLIIEVLSKSTEQKDYREKLLAYQAIPSLQNYLIVAQNNCHIDLFYREKGGDWWIQTFESIEDSIELACPECKINVAEVYEGIELS